MSSRSKINNPVLYHVMDKFTRKYLLKKIAASAGILTDFIEKNLKKDEVKPKFIPLTSLGPGTSVFMSENAVKADGSVDIIVNFRGVSGDPTSVGANFANKNAVIITSEAVGDRSKNKGSALLEQQFGNVNKLNELVGRTLTYLQKQFPEKNIKRGKLIVSGFSGGGSVVARVAAERDKIPGGLDGIVINDGLHSNPKTPEGRKLLDSLTDFAREAEKDPSKKFKILHTAIRPGSYASTTETADYILNQLNLERKKTDSRQPYSEYGFVPKAEARRGGVEIVQMFDDPNVPYYTDNRAGSLGATHVDALWKGNPYIFRDVL